MKKGMYIVLLILMVSLFGCSDKDIEVTVQFKDTFTATLEVGTETPEWEKQIQLLDEEGIIVIRSTTINDDEIDLNQVGEYNLYVEVIHKNELEVIKSITLTIEVIDTTNPVLTLLGDETVYVEYNETYTDQGVECTDNYVSTCDAVINNPTDTSTLGTYEITYDFTDSQGNVASQLIRTVIVEDTTSPLLSIVGEDIVRVPQLSIYQDLGVDCTDNYDTTCTVVIDNPVNTSVPGIYTITYSYTDSEGNVALQVTRTVDVYIHNPNTPGLINILDELPNEQITITFWHVYGTSNEDILDGFIEEFELLYPNITIDATSQGSYGNLNDKVNLSIAAGITPTMIVAYPDHMAGYLNSGAVVPLDDFIYDDTWGLTEADGTTIGLGDFIDSYVEESRQFDGGWMYSLPYSKATDVMIFNKTIFEANGLTIPTDRALTFAELEAYADIMVGDGANQCEYLINYDSGANLFINSSRMWNAGYTNSAGDILVDNPNTISMLNTLKGYFENRTIALPIAWNQSYGSQNFLAGDSCMTVGSSAGIRYNIPDDSSFQIGIAPIPQWDEAHKSAPQPGPNLAILNNSTDAERLAAWLFMEYITDTDQTALWSMLTGYLPVRHSAVESDFYQLLLGINDIDPAGIDTLIFKYVDNGIIDPSIEDLIAHFETEKIELHATFEALTGSAQTDQYVIKMLYLITMSEKYTSMAANASLLQESYFMYEPAFVTPQTTSSDARSQAGIVMNALFIGNYTIEELIEDMLYQLGEE